MLTAILLGYIKTVMQFHVLDFDVKHFLREFFCNFSKGNLEDLLKRVIGSSYTFIFTPGDTEINLFKIVMSERKF